MKLRIGLLALALSGAVSLPGCGGGGGGGSSPVTPAGRGTLNVFVTDDFSQQFSQVWVTLYKIELSTDGTNYQTVFSDTSGQTLDLASLSATTQFLNSITVPAGSYTSARVTLGNTITVVPASGGTGSTLPVDGGVDVGNNMRAITLTTHTAVAASQISNLVLDFNLAAFQLIGGHVRPEIREGDGGMVGQRQRRARLAGTVSDLVAGTSFNLNLPSGLKVAVTLSAATTIYAADGSSNPTLANGQRVVVEGTVDTTANTLAADAVRIEGDQTNIPAVIFGTVGTVDATAQTFTLTPREIEHHLPVTGGVTVVVNGSTVFRAPHGQTVDFTNVTGGANVIVMGTLDATTNTLTAKLIGIGIHH